MIIVTFNKPDFEYDVHSLLKEFFPKEDIQMYYREPANFSESKNLACTSQQMIRRLILRGQATDLRFAL